MKRLIPFLILLCSSTLLWGQSVRLDRNGTEYLPVDSDVAAWQAQYSPSLHGFPVAVEIALTNNTPETFSFRNAERVVLVADTDISGLRGRLAITSEDGFVLELVHISNKSDRTLIDIPAGTFNLHYQQIGGKSDAQLTFTRVYVVPQHQQNTTRDFGFNTSFDCHPNANCPDAGQWADEVRSSVRIMMVLEEGIGWCSGTLMNNTNLDGTPYILSAEHCLLDFTPLWDLWRFDFNYASLDCINPTEEPRASSLTGCTLRAKERDTDFMLLELDDNLPVFYEPYFSGWNRTPQYAPNKTALIHHPSGDITKLSTDFHQISLWENVLNWNEGYSTPAGTHYRGRFDAGTFEPGSSGGAIYDTSGHVIGQLHGGIGDCNANTAYSGRLASSWEYSDTSSGQLMQWLDPAGTGAMILDGMEHPDAGNVYQVTGQVRDPQGRPVSGVTITLDSAIQLTVEADSNGMFSIPKLPRSSEVIFSARKNINPKNGVSATDLLLIKKHLLGDAPFAENWQVLASDATGNVTVSAGDILILQKLLLGLVSVLPTQDAWVFDPPQISILEPVEGTVQLEFTAIKVGDVNGTVDPSQ